MDRRSLLMLLCILLVSVPAAAKPVAIKADCKNHKVSASLKVADCYRAEPLSQLTLELAGAAKAVHVARDINPEGTFDGSVSIDDHGDRMVSLSYENSECTVALLIKRDDGSILADSGCTNSQYCTIPELQAKDGCMVAIHCGDGAKGKPALQVAGKSVVMVAEAEARVLLIAKETLDATSVRVTLRIPPEGVIGHVDVALRNGVWIAVAADLAER